MDAGRVQEIAELEVRRYFDRYLADVFPGQIETIMKAHNESTEAHGGILEQFKKLRWTLIGMAVSGGFGAGLGVDKFLSLFN